MYAKYLSKLSNMPARTAEWAGRNGPVAWWGVDNLNNGSSKRLTDVFLETALHSDTDTYHTVKWFEEGPIEAPPASIPHLSVLNCGVMTPETPVAANNMEWYAAAMTAAATIVEKGYVPVTIGGDPNITLPVVEGIRRVTNEDIVLVNFGADARLSTSTAPAKVLLGKKTVDRYMQMGGRGLDKAARLTRKEYECKYMDMNALFARNVSMIKDIKGDYSLYVSIDLAVLDPVFAPGVPKLEPGGLSVRELLHLLNVVRGKKIVGVDLVGYDPKYEAMMPNRPYGITELNAGKIAKELILKSYYTTSMTSQEAQVKLQEMRRSGDAPAHYPEF
jgi:arginase family enzyme